MILTRNDLTNRQNDDFYIQGKQHEFTEKDIVEAFRAFDLDKNTYVAAADIRHVLLNIRESLTDEEVKRHIAGSTCYMHVSLHSVDSWRCRSTN